MKHLLRISDLTAPELHALVELAAQPKELPHRFQHVLDGETVVLHVTEPSLHCRIAFATAVARLGGVPVATGPADLAGGRGQPVDDTVRAISSVARAFVIRTFADGDVRRWAAAASVPVVNAGTHGHDPCQAVADLLTLREHFGRLAGLKVAYIGDGASAAHSLVQACALAGVDIAVATPPGYECAHGVVDAAALVAKEHGAGVLETHDPLVAAADADAVYTDVWIGQGDEDEREVRMRSFAGYRIDAGVMDVAAKHAVFMHPLPFQRGIEVTSNVVDGPRSVVFAQAENRLHAAVAALVDLVGCRSA
jgi:ornithine carbamoyltransferase